MALRLAISEPFGMRSEDCTRVQSTPSQVEMYQANCFLHARTLPTLERLETC